MPKQNIVCFGELLLRFSPEMQGVFIEKQVMPVFIGGAELNVASALAKWHMPVAYCSALPENNLSEEIIASIAAKNINIDNINISGERIGSYFLPQGADLKNNAVIYDRNHSSFSCLRPGDLDWDEILEDASWFHLSAISPALNENVAGLCLEGVEAAHGKGITVSIDLNYRAKLWQYGKQPQDVMPDIVSYCNVIMGNIWSAEKLLDVPFVRELIENPSDENYILAAADSAQNIMHSFPSCNTVANTFRFDAGEGIKYFATLHHENEHYRSSVFNADKIVDKVGSGDCFMGGLIYGIHSGMKSTDTIEFAAAAAYSKLFEKGDATSNDVEVIKHRMNNG